MTLDEALALINGGRISVWNEYRGRNPNWAPDLAGQSLRGDLMGINLSGANLSGSTILGGDLKGIDLSGANLSGSTISGQLRVASLRGANLQQAKISAQIESTCFSSADLRGADLSESQANGVLWDSQVDPQAKWVIGPLEISLKKARFDVKTKFPPGIDPALGGAEFVSASEQDNYEASRAQVFISYAWANDDVVLAVDAWLRSKGLHTKLDKRDFFAGAPIRGEIMRVMKESDVILIFHSQASANKPWPEFERELAADLEMAAKKEKKRPPRTIYVVIDEVKLPSVLEENKIAVMAKGKRFTLVCEELYHSILQLPRKPADVDLAKWNDYVF